MASIHKRNFIVITLIVEVLLIHAAVYNGLNIAGNEVSFFQTIIDITRACSTDSICMGSPVIIIRLCLYPVF